MLKADNTISGFLGGDFGRTISLDVVDLWAEKIDIETLNIDINNIKSRLKIVIETTDNIERFSMHVIVLLLFLLESDVETL